MHNDLLIFLKENKIFSTLNENILHQLINNIRRVELKNGDILFKQDQNADTVYFLVRGKLTASIITSNHQLKIIDHINVGQMAGELAVLANEPYPCTVMASQDAVIYQLPKANFIDLCYQNPAFMLEIVRPVISRTHTMLPLLAENDANQSIAIVPANKHVSMLQFIEKFTDILLANNKIILISEYTNEHHTVTEWQAKIQQIKHTIKPSEQIIYLLKSSHTPLATLVLKNSDKLYLVTNSLSKPLIDPILTKQIQQNTLDSKSLPYLIILHPATTQMPTQTSLWLQQTAFKMHHHLRLDLNKHYYRLLRFIQQEANGVVLGGGGTRGWGHIGAIKALCDQEYPIDFIGGTSVGAIIGACYAMRESYEDTYTKFSKIVATSKHSISWRSITLPIVSVYNAKSFTHANLEVFENVLIEDLWLPFFCISSNLANFNEEVHQSGLLWEKIRASASIPGLIPPMVINGDIHFDGGLLNNLPVDVMTKLLGKKAKTIAVELNSSMQDGHKYHFPPVLSFKQSLMAKIGLNKESLRFPRFMDVFLRGLLIGSSAKAKHNGQGATILVNLSLRKFRMLKYSNKQAQKMIEIGFLETTSQLHQYKNRNF